MRIIVTTCNAYINRAMRPFAFLFNHFWSRDQDVTVIGAKPSKYALPSNFRFVSVGDEWPKKEYTTELMPLLRAMPDEHFVWLLDDYWLTEKVDFAAVAHLIEYMKEVNTKILRMDLTADRWKSTHAEDVGKWGKFDIIETKGKHIQYQMSLQAGIWNTRWLLEVLQEGWSPWDVELSGTSVVNERTDLRVLGTKQSPVKYTNALGMGNEGINTTGVPDELVAQMQEMGWLDKVG